MGWLLPLGSHKVMGSFAGYSVSVGTFEIVRLFFNGFFFSCRDLMDCFFGLFFPRPRTSYSSPYTYHSTFPLPQDFLDVIFLSRPCLLFRTPEHFFFYDQPEAILFFLCLKKTCDVWRRRLAMPEEAFHTTRHRPRRRHQEFSLVAPSTPIWLAHSHFAWQTKLWLS